jgi:hypothetical protein
MQCLAVVDCLTEHSLADVCDLMMLISTDNLWMYEGESNENRKTEIKIRNIAPLSYKLADMLPML